MTGRSKTAQFQPDTVQIAPDDARRLGIVDGQPVRLCSRYGEITIAANDLRYGQGRRTVRHLSVARSVCEPAHQPEP